MCHWHHLNWDVASLHSQHSILLCCICNSGSSNIWANIAVIILLSMKWKDSEISVNYGRLPRHSSLGTSSISWRTALRYFLLLLPEEKRWLGEVAIRAAERGLYFLKAMILRAFRICRTLAPLFLHYNRCQQEPLDSGLRLLLRLASWMA
jgi:hypothetical protein